ncbi:MAG: hypothetical protein JOY69_00835 [Candidatus Eremiobacteraeota bacterium]|nr:hypothetical protein [Candidatus Eremiobacteraeota bacterium]
MMAPLARLVFATCAVFAIGCSAPSPREQTTASELAAMAPLKHEYPGIVMGFDVRNDSTVLVSLDLQTFIGMDDDAAAAMKQHVVQRWRVTWARANPGRHALLHVRFIDFIGRTIAAETIRA